ncbi:MAG TPA: histidine--tRNA ligase [Candidatus Nanoarchaeia archaeon]|nr:histidine--tRNA ligase [Candidatus Nanoarchaeia archaeon]
MHLERPKGTRDFPPEEELLKNTLLETLTKVFQLYGYNPMQTPVFERLETFTLKYAGGEEILKEVFKLQDQGGRDLALRFDLTVPLSRYVGMNPQIKMPFKRFQIGEVFRDGPIKLGRYRQFIQCDADVVGSKSLLSEVELLNLGNEVFKRLNVPVVFKINNIKVLNGLTHAAGVPEEQTSTILLTLDKLEKFGTESVKQELAAKGLNVETIEKLLRFFLKGGDKTQLNSLKKILPNNEGVTELAYILKHAKNTTFEPSLCRGLNYYTGTIFEGYFKNSQIKSSCCSGGRYDNLISNMLNTPRAYPAVGISFGLDVILEELKTKKHLSKKTLTHVFIIPINAQTHSLRLAQHLRRQGVNTDIDLMGRGPSKNLEYINALSIPYALFVGSDEIKKKKYKLKDMKTGKEQLLGFPSLLKKLKN